MGRRGHGGAQARAGGNGRATRKRPNGSQNGGARAGKAEPNGRGRERSEGDGAPPPASGGRPAGQWVEVQPAEIRRYRGRMGLGRKRLADLLGVSQTTVQNWESGASVAGRALQERLRRVIDGDEPIPPARRGGPRASSEVGWVHVTPADVERYRQEQGLSYYGLASRLRVSPGSVNNWLKKGRPASLRAQEQIREVLEGHDGQQRVSGPVHSDEVMGVGIIVRAYLESHRDIALEQLIELIGVVRRSLQAARWPTS